MVYARPSDIGRIPPRSKLEHDFKSFLIDFRSIIECNISIEQKLFMINDELSIKSEAYKDIYQKLVLERRFPDSFFRNMLCELNGVSTKTASILWES